MKLLVFGEVLAKNSNAFFSNGDERSVSFTNVDFRVFFRLANQSDLERCPSGKSERRS